MIFVDTSFLVAMFNKNDHWHEKSGAILPIVKKEDTITSTLILSEAITYIGSRSGGKQGILLHDYIIDNYELVYTDKKLHSGAIKKFLTYNGTLSFADVISVEIMETRGIKQIVSFDSDFDKVKGIKRIY